MDPKAYLLRYEETQHQIEANAQEAIRLRSLREKCTVSFDSDCSGTSGDGQRIPRITEQLLQLEAQTHLLTLQLETVRQEIIATINALPDYRHRELLRYRYLADMTLEQTARKMNYCYKQARRIHGIALLRVKDVLECPPKPVL